MHRPERTCIGCRGRGDKFELLRLVQPAAAAASGTVVVDLRQVEPGRGAYLHRHPDCLDLAVRRRAVGRALRAPQLDSRQLVLVLQPHLQPGPVTA